MLLGFVFLQTASLALSNDIGMSFKPLSGRPTELDRDLLHLHHALPPQGLRRLWVGSCSVMCVVVCFIGLWSKSSARLPWGRSIPPRSSGSTIRPCNGSSPAVSARDQGSPRDGDGDDALGLAEMLGLDGRRSGCTSS
jgi:hypothetical protein